MFPPTRIICLTEETVETLYLLGEEERIVGISGYVVRPPRARREKPRVSAFTSADIPKILDLKPDLVLTFSDLQADIVATLIRYGIEVHAFNQRTIMEILDMIRMLGALVGATDRADHLAEDLAASIVSARERAAQLPRRPKVYFEEWDDPMISCIGWVSELIDAAGGIDIFADRASCKSAKDRIVTAEEVIRRDAKRLGFDRIPAAPERRSLRDQIVGDLAAGPGGSNRWTCGVASDRQKFRRRDFQRVHNDWLRSVEIQDSI